VCFWWLLLFSFFFLAAFPSSGLSGGSGHNPLVRRTDGRLCAYVRKLIDDASIEDRFLPPASQCSSVGAACSSIIRLLGPLSTRCCSRFVLPCTTLIFGRLCIRLVEFLYPKREVFVLVLANRPGQYVLTRFRHHIQTKAIPLIRRKAGTLAVPLLRRCLGWCRESLSSLYSRLHLRPGTMWCWPSGTTCLLPIRGPAA